jgi:hypothetical protein
MAVAQRVPLDARPQLRPARAFGPSLPDGFDLAVLAGFGALSVWILVLYLVRVVGHDQPWPGTDGIFIGDQMMYLAWIKDASRHLLISDLFVLRPTPHDYLQPAIAMSAGLVKLGVAPWVALLAWQPVAVGAVFFAVRGLARRLFIGRVSRRAALVIALFGGSIGTYIAPDLWIGFWSWGYPFAMLGLASAIGSLLLYATGRRTVVAALLGGFASWLHPWVGEVLLLVFLGTDATMWLAHRRWHFARLAAVLAGTALPLVYYAALSRFDPAWRMGQNASIGTLPFSTLVLMLAPLLVPALLAYRVHPSTFLQAVMRVWPPVALVVFWLAKLGLGNTPSHALLGITVPLAMLAVEGIASLSRPSFVSQRAVAALAALAVLGVCVPVTVSSMKDSSAHVRDRARIDQSGWRALTYLARAPESGGVLTSQALGVMVPGETGRRTYIGNGFWSRPDPQLRHRLVQDLITGQMRPVRARAFVRSTGARFLLAGCGSHRRRLARELGTLIVSERQFGCASVYLLD